MSYRTFRVTYEHTTPESETVRQNTAVVTIWGESEFRMKKAVEDDRPGHTTVVILESEET